MPSRARERANHQARPAPAAIATSGQYRSQKHRLRSVITAVSARASNCSGLNGCAKTGRKRRPVSRSMVSISTSFSASDGAGIGTRTARPQPGQSKLTPPALAGMEPFQPQGHRRARVTPASGCLGGGGKRDQLASCKCSRASLTRAARKGAKRASFSLSPLTRCLCAS